MSPRAVFNVAEHAAADAAAATAGVPFLDLMEAAGNAVAAEARAAYAPRPTLVLAGPGGNGGDGRIAARRLAEAGWPVSFTALGEGDATAGRGWAGPEMAIDAALDPRAFGLVIDALFGAGLRRPVPAPAAALLKAARGAGARVLAVDVPSGLLGDTGQALGPVTAADLTVTFLRPKPAHLLEPGRSLCGRIRAHDIGHPPAALQGLGAALAHNAPALWASRLPWPRAQAHKHARGRLLVVTGGAGQTGAARLAARGALRIGAGLVTLLTPPGALLVAAAHETAIMTRSVREPSELADAAREADALVFGPAAGLDAHARGRLDAVLAAPCALVLDADALTLAAEASDAFFATVTARPDPVVLTPHRGEFARLFPDLAHTVDADRLGAVRAAAARSGAVVLLKGPDTIIASPRGRAIVNTHASPFLATAGSGDVLAGAIGGLLAQDARAQVLGAHDTAAAAAWLHGDAGLRLGPGLTAEDLPAALSTSAARLYDHLRPGG